MDKTICLIDVEDSAYYYVGVSEDPEESRAEFRAGSHKLLATKPLSHQEGENTIGKLKSCNVGYDAAQKWWKIHEDDVAVLAEIFPEAAFSPFIYLIRMEGNEFYTVGHSKNPEERRKSLQTGNPHLLSFVCKKQTSDSKGEGKVKDALKNYKANQGGGSEWFKLDTPSKVDEAKNAIDGLKPTNQSPFIYLIHMEGNEFYTVGHSKNPEERRKSLQTGNPYLLSFVCKKQTSDSEGEGKVKDALKNYKANQGGGTKWFKLDTRSKVDEAKNAIDGLEPAN
ncbi:uncharacterized protein [Scyliorhinus torazame]|uniref:uncharacterized protein isoform X2 n=1 Tax=Scyliorhinus torazame TaxID=75743 RepID=UPI003B5AC3A5